MRDERKIILKGREEAKIQWGDPYHAGGDLLVGPVKGGTVEITVKWIEVMK